MKLTQERHQDFRKAKPARNIFVNDNNDQGDICVAKAINGTKWIAIDCGVPERRIHSWKLDRISSNGHVVIEPAVYSSLSAATAAAKKSADQLNGDLLLAVENPRKKQGNREGKRNGVNGTRKLTK